MSKGNRKHSIQDNTIANTKTILKELEDNQQFLPEEIVSLLNQVSLENIKSKVTGLSSFHTRHTKSIYINEVAEWLKNEFEEIGYKNVSFHEYKKRIDSNKYNLKNIICKKDGNNNKCIVICAHYDSRMENKDDYTSRAPGANDNASGVGAILEIARILYNKKLQYDLQFVFFSGEEQNLLGSKKYAKFIRKNRIDLYRMINLDMIGYPLLNPGKVIIETDKIIETDDITEFELHNKVISNDMESTECGKIMIKMCTYTSLMPLEGQIYDSDYEPFEKRGYVVVGAYDGSAEPEKNPHYHSTTDTPKLIDWNYLTSVTKMILATILTLNKEMNS